MQAQRGNVKVYAVVMDRADPRRPRSGRSTLLGAILWIAGLPLVVSLVAWPESHDVRTQQVMTVVPVASVASHLERLGHTGPAYMWRLTRRWEEIVSASADAWADGTPIDEDDSTCVALAWDKTVVTRSRSVRTILRRRAAPPVPALKRRLRAARAAQAGLAGSRARSMALQQPARGATHFGCVMPGPDAGLDWAARTERAGVDAE